MLEAVRVQTLTAVTFTFDGLWNLGGEGVASRAPCGDRVGEGAQLRYPGVSPFEGNT
jgi:hypothetical protein